MLFLKQSHILPFLCHKSTTACQIDSNKVSNSELKIDLCHCVKTEIIESTASVQRQHKQGTLFWDNKGGSRTCPKRDKQQNVLTMQE